MSNQIKSNNNITTTNDKINTCRKETKYKVIKAESLLTSWTSKGNGQISTYGVKRQSA